jgi:hypothetical protein
MIANDDVVFGWRRLDHKLDHPLSIGPIDEVWIGGDRVCPLHDSIDTVITAALVPICVGDVAGEEGETQERKVDECILTR